MSRFVLLLYVIAWALMGWAAAPTVTRTETVIGVADSTKQYSYTSSPDGRPQAWVEKTTGGVRVSCNGVAGKTWKLIRGIRFSPDSRQVTYLAFDGKNWHLVRDDESLDQSTSEMEWRFTPDSAAIIVTRQQEPRLRIIGNTPLKITDLRGLSFTTDGKHVINRISNEEGGYRANRLMLDGKELYHDAWITSMAFSHNGAHWACAASTNAMGGEYRFVHDGRIQETGHFSAQYIRFSPDGQRVAAVLHAGTYDMDDWCWKLLLDDKIGPVGQDYYTALTFSPDSKHFAYIVGGHSLNYMESNSYNYISSDFVLDGKRIISFDRIPYTLGYCYDITENPVPAIVFSPDSTKVAIAGHTKAEGDVLLVNEKITIGLGRISAICFSPDSSRMACLSDDTTVLIDGIRQQSYQRILRETLRFKDNTTVQYLALSRDGKRWLLVEEAIQ